MSLKPTSAKKFRKKRKKYKAETWEEYEQLEKDLMKEMMRYQEPTITGQVRVTAGRAKNIKLDIPRRTRPLTDRMKTQIFDSLEKDIYKRSVLDLYAGSGSFGLEALSRGASEATFVDAAKHAEKILETNITKTGFLSESTVVRSKSMDFLNRALNEERVFEIIFIDPPYKLFNKKFKERVIEVLKRSMLLLPGVQDKETDLFKGVIILKHPRIYPIDQVEIMGLKLLDTYTYGMNAISIFFIDFENLDKEE